MNPASKALISVFASTFLQLVAGFMLLPWLLYRLSEDGVTVAVSGVFAASSWIGILAFTPVASRLVQRFGRQQTLWMASFMTTLSFAGILLTSKPEWWFAFILLESAAAGLRWVVGEALVVELAPSGHCGRCVGLYETMVGSTFFLGPVLLNFLGTDNPAVPGWALFMAGSTLGLTLWIGQAPTARPLASQTGALSGLPQALRRNGALAVVAFVGGFFEGGVSTVLPLYGLSLGFDTPLSTWLVAASGLASAVVMLPAGLLVDRLARQRMRLGTGDVEMTRMDLMRWCATLTMALTAVMPWLANLPAVAIAVAFFWGGAGGCLYTLTVIDISEHESGTGLFEATTVLVLAYTLGAIAGPLLGSAAMQWSNPMGFPLLLLIVSSLGWWTLALARRKKPSPKADPAST